MTDFWVFFDTKRRSLLRLCN